MVRSFGVNHNTGGTNLASIRSDMSSNSDITCDDIVCASLSATGDLTADTISAGLTFTGGSAAFTTVSAVNVLTGEGLSSKGGITADDISAMGDLTADTISAGLTFTGGSAAFSTVSATGNLTAAAISTLGAMTANGAISGTGAVNMAAGTFSGDLSSFGNLIGTNATLCGDLQAYRFKTSAADVGGTLDNTQFGTTITVNAASANTVTLPSVAAGDVGSWFRFVKLGAGSVKIAAVDSDLIADSTAGGGISCSATGETYATLTIQLADTTHWVVTGAHGTWITDG